MEHKSFLAAIVEFEATGTFDCSNTSVSPDELRLVRAAAQDVGGNAAITFKAEGTTFDGHVPLEHCLVDGSFARATFKGDAHFAHSTFDDDTSFSGAVFEADAVFANSRGGAKISFRRAHFGAVASFRGATFGERANFRNAHFGRTANFRGSTFGASAMFAEAHFLQAADFRDAKMDEDAVFRNVEFHGRCQFVGATLGDGAVFRRVRFSRGSRLARTTWGRRVSFDHATFEQQPSLADARFGDHASFAHTAWGPFANLANVQFGEKAMFRDATFANGAVIANGSFGSGAILRRASFGAGAILEGSRFASAACLDDAAFAEDANLSGTRFGRSSTLKGTRFGHDCSFADCSFEADADFSRATFRDRAHFLRGRFGGGSSFNDVTFGTEPKLIGCSFGPSVSFERLRCGEHAAFGATTFDRDASFEGATFKGDAQFIGSRFDEGGRIGPLSAGGAIELDGATISRPATIDIYASRVSCRRLRIDDGASFRLTAKSVDLSEVSFVKPTTVAPHVAGAKGSLAITSLRGSDTAALLLADVDLTSCSFVGAHNLDHLRIDGPLRLTRALRGRGRQTIADEQTWRAPGPDVSDPQTVAGLYRALRKAREDSKDAPGAADFYYGEMHMRRQALMATAKLTFHDRAELSILSLYWLLAGYGLRVWRPLLLLVGLVLLTGAAFATWGLPPRGCAEAPFAPAVSELRPLEQLRRSQIIEPREARSCRRAAAYSAGVLHSAESATSLLRSSARPLTDFGEVLQLFVRLAGPLLLAFAVLALRSRVQR